MNVKDSKQKMKRSVKRLTPSHSRVWYGIMRRGKVLGGMSNPELFSLKQAEEYIHDVPKNTKIVKIRVTHEVISEVIV
jgi:hypothetical protein